MINLPPERPLPTCDGSDNVAVSDQSMRGAGASPLTPSLASPSSSIVTPGANQAPSDCPADPFILMCW